MKTKFEILEKNAHLMTCAELSDACIELASDLKNVSSDMFSVRKAWCGHGCWVSTTFANSYYFGDVLSDIIVKACTGIKTFDEAKVFSHDDYGEFIADYIFDHIYNRVVYS